MNSHFDLWQYYLPTRIIFGWNALEQLPKAIASIDGRVKRIFLVTGQHALKKTGYLDAVLKLLNQFDVVLFDKVEANPVIATVDAGTQQLKDTKCAVVIAIGGGSVIDAAKAMCVLATNKATVEEYQRDQKAVERDGIPLIACPTTAGTSSEMTVWSVITNVEGHYKKSFSNEKMYPKIAIIDPQLTVSMPPNVTAATGLDAMAHCIEGFWSKKTQPLSRILAIDGLRLIFAFLKRAFDNGQDREAREKMALAAMLAGLSFSNSKTGLPHKASYPITMQFHIPHGAACALTLPAFFEYLGEKDTDAIMDILNVMGVASAKEGRKFLTDFVRSVGMPVTFKELGANEDDISYIAKKSYMEPHEQVEPCSIDFNTYQKILLSVR